jgi:OOP family OmpA-OmpF porin
MHFIPKNFFIVLILSQLAFLSFQFNVVLAQEQQVNMKFKIEGAKLLFTTKPKFAEYTDASSWWYNNLETKEKTYAVGEFTRKLYEVPMSSSFEVVYNYETQLVAMGFKIINRYKNAHGDWFVRRHICKNDLCGTLEKTSNDLTKELMSEQTIIAKKTTSEGDYTAVVAGGEIKTNMRFNPPSDTLDSQGGQAPSVVLTPGHVLLLVDIIAPKQIEKKIVSEEISYIKGKLNAEGSVNIYGIFFDFDKASVKSESATALKNIADVLTEDANLKLNILGHTDNQGTQEYNLKLSEKRAKAVVGYLVAIHGIDESRLLAIGKGMNEPLESNDSEEGKAKNRRVELKKF